jgi:hypothetical protein
MSDSRRETSLSLSGQNRPSVMEVVQVDDIPVLVARPDQAGASDRLALWMHFLGGNKEAMAPLGGNDLHINCQNAYVFKTALAMTAPAAADRTVIRIHPNLDHFDAGRDGGVQRACLEWLLG